MYGLISFSVLAMMLSPITCTTTCPSIYIAPGATASSSIVTSSKWQWNHDPGTPGASAGSSTITSSPSLSGGARKFAMNYTSSGGEIFHVDFAQDAMATHFVYDAYIYLDDTAANIANLELDMNQVISNGATVIYGVQCDGYSGTWDYTVADTKGGTTWKNSNVPCNVRNWPRFVWNHVQLSYHRDSVGVVTYDQVMFNCTIYNFSSSATGNSAFQLGWASAVLLTNFQIDGLGASGAATVLADNMTVYHWVASSSASPTATTSTTKTTSKITTATTTSKATSMTTTSKATTTTMTAAATTIAPATTAAMTTDTTTTIDTTPATMTSTVASTVMQSVTDVLSTTPATSAQATSAMTTIVTSPTGSPTTTQSIGGGLPSTAVVSHAASMCLNMWYILIGGILVVLKR